MQDAFVKPLLKWYRLNRRDLPWRRTSDPYAVWISEIMLQQTRVEAVKDYYERFLKELPDVNALAKCPDDKLMKLWEGLGYYSRARNLKKAACLIAERGGSFPSDYDSLIALPGIGPYTAGAVSSIAFGLPVPAIDGNVLRVYARMQSLKQNILLPSVRKEAEEYYRRNMESLLSGEQGEAAQRPAQMKRPDGNPAGDFTQSLIELGALICVPNAKPECGGCPVREYCSAFREGIAEELPIRIKDTKRKTELRTVLLVRDGAQTAICKRNGAGLLAGLYEFPNLPGFLDSRAVVEYIEQKGFTALRVRPIGEARHLFSHIEWRMTGYEIRIAPDRERQEGAGEKEEKWIFAGNSEIADKYAVPSAFSVYLKYLTGSSSKRGKE